MGHLVSVYDTCARFSASSTLESVRLHVGLRGDHRFTYQQLSRSFDLAGGHHNIMYSQGIDLEIYNKTLEIETFGVDFPKDAFIRFTQRGNDQLDRFTEAMLNGKGALLSEHWGTIIPPVQRIIDEIRLTPYSGALQNVFLLAKSLELLVLCIDQYEQSARHSPVYLKSKADQERIIAARDWINERVDAPPSLSELARAVGLNECKLKRGFKEWTVSGTLAVRCSGGESKTELFTLKGYW